MQIPFAKVESIGNDFVLIEDGAVSPDRYSELAIKACRRRYSVGSDGLLVLDPAFNLRMFNPDGTEDFCGNGMRAAAAYADLKGWIPSDEFLIVHRGKEVPSRRIEGGYETTLGLPSYEPSDVPNRGSGPVMDSQVGPVKLSSLSTGSTHAIVKVEAWPESPEFEKLGAEIEHHAMFPERTSVIWAWPTGERALSIRIWERGVGETQGCGTGSSAAAVEFSRQWGPGWIDVKNPGGGVRAFAALDQPVRIQGPGRVVYSGVLDL